MPLSAQDIGLFKQKLLLGKVLVREGAEAWLRAGDARLGRGWQGPAVPTLV